MKLKSQLPSCEMIFFYPHVQRIQLKYKGYNDKLKLFI